MGAPDRSLLICCCVALDTGMRNIERNSRIELSSNTSS
ncbi:hypothetical protein PORCAN_1513 [Porphyromonas crevioricanis JCM 13913]|nr:hypothetical protein PORCAN_1513 [Porphyromonas crevioricanis JCM 13913]